MSNSPPNSHGHPTLQELELAREGLLSARQNAEIVRHLSNCEECQAAIQQYEGTFQTFREHRQEQVSWSNFGSRLDDADRQEVAKRTARLLALTGRMPLRLLASRSRSWSFTISDRSDVPVRANSWLAPCGKRRLDRCGQRVESRSRVAGAAQRWYGRLPIPLHMFQPAKIKLRKSSASFSTVIT